MPVLEQVSTCATSRLLISTRWDQKLSTINAFVQILGNQIILVRYWSSEAKGKIKLAYYECPRYPSQLFTEKKLKNGFLLPVYHLYFNIYFLVPKMTMVETSLIYKIREINMKKKMWKIIMSSTCSRKNTISKCETSCIVFAELKKLHSLINIMNWVVQFGK